MKGDRQTVFSKAGYRKIHQCCEKALLNGFDYLWVDTCCIDKRSSAELSEAINTMFKWYQNSAVCYAYLADVSSKGEPMSKNVAFETSRWFTRGWTLQELIAPPRVHFLNQDWVKIGTKEDLSNRIAEISGVHAQILASPFDPRLATIAQKMSWAAGRKTTRIEDIVYCLMGLFGVNMPLLYGEGRNAFQRLQRKLIKTTHDHSIFAWRGHRGSEHSSFLAYSPDDFSDCGTICLSIPRALEWEPYSWTNLGIRIRLDAVYGEHGSRDWKQFYVVLDCCYDDRPNTRIGVWRCNGYHEHCHINRSHGRKGINIRLMDVVNQCIVHGTLIHRYFALSYVWGGVERLKATKDNIAAFGKKGSCVSVWQAF